MIPKDIRQQSGLVFFSVISVTWVLNFGFNQSAFLLDYMIVPYWWLVYIVLIPQFLISFRFNFQFVQNKDKVPELGKKFIISLSIKAALCILFLLPWLIDKDESSRPMVAHFFYVFFILLTVETGLLVSYLNRFDEEFKEEE